MKARVQTKIVKQELQAIYDDLYKTFAADMTKNITAAVFVVLARRYGWNTEELLDLQQSIEEHFVLMELPFPGTPYDTTVDSKWLKKEMGIDLAVSRLRSTS